MPDSARTNASSKFDLQRCSRGRCRAGSVAADPASEAPGDVESLSGRLYLTTARLVLLARTPDGPSDAELSVPLDDVEELACVGERLLVSLADGTGLTIDAGRPRLLRVQIAAARAAARDASQRPEETDETEDVPSTGLLGLGPAVLPLEA